MKVKCINTNGWVMSGRRFLFFNLMDKDVKGPKFGDIVTVLNSTWEDGELFYELQEWPMGSKHIGWDADQFVSMEATYEKVKASQIKEIASVN